LDFTLELDLQHLDLYLEPDMLRLLKTFMAVVAHVSQSSMHTEGPPAGENKELEQERGMQDQGSTLIHAAKAGTQGAPTM